MTQRKGFVAVRRTRVTVIRPKRTRATSPQTNSSDGVGHSLFHFAVGCSCLTLLTIIIPCLIGLCFLMCTGLLSSI